MRCEEIEPIVEAIADGTAKPDDAAREHLSTCALCAARVAQAREIDRFLASRDTPQPPAAFTSMVMARIATERWRAERVVDFGFNLAIAAGVIVILASARRWARRPRLRTPSSSPATTRGPRIHSTSSTRLPPGRVRLAIC